MSGLRSGAIGVFCEQWWARLPFQALKTLDHAVGDYLNQARLAA